MQYMEINKYVSIQRCKDIIKPLIEINTVNPPGNEMDIVKKILSFFPIQKLNYKVIEHGINRASLIINIPGKNVDKSIAFVGHLDTVPVENASNWMYPPFSGVIDGGYIYGRGSADMKGGISSMILTALYFIENDIIPDQNLCFCFTADEEKDGKGIISIRDSGYLKNISEVFICEPSQEKLGIAEKGALWLKIIVKGKEAHSAMPDLGINAIERVAEYIKKIKESINTSARHHLLGETTVAITKLQGGIKSNIIPSLAEATIDIRTIPGAKHEEIIRKANEIAENMMRDEDLYIETIVENDRPAIEIKGDHPFIEKLKNVYANLSYECTIKGMSFYTDGSQFISYLDVPFVILGPGDDSLAHQTDERIMLSSISKVVEIYVNYILNV